ncbi:MAG TPA: response regulator [Polyangia bacterium]|nr:response regulator [Polyangia bacterium]
MTRLLRLLIVEDREDDAELLLLELARGGFDVDYERVQTAHAMSDALARRAWDMIISDYSMPGFGALQALSTMRGSGVELPFVVVSGTIGEESAVEALRNGARDFIVKGQLARLLPAVERELQESRGREARREAERALRDSEQQVRLLLDSTGEGIFGVDLQGRCTFANRAAIDMLGYSGTGELVGRPVHDLLHRARADGARCLEQDCRLRRALGADRAGYIDDESLDRTDGVRLIAEMRLFPVMRDGQRVGAVASFVDVSHRKRLEAQLRQAQKMEAIGSLAGGVAHDFNNLLSVILSYSDMLLDGLKGGDPMRADLEEIKKAGERASVLTRQLLAFSRQQLLQPRILDLNQILGGLQSMLRRLLGEDVELSLLTARVIGQVRADPGQIEQVVMNLVVNARDAMLDGGKISIETDNVELGPEYATTNLGVTPGPYVMMAVTDTGTGMDAATQARIFEPFFTTKEKGRGTGLGLSTIFGIVQQSGGHIWVYSEPGKGTTFRIYLPRVDGVVEAIDTPPTGPVNLRGNETALLVEDDEQVRTISRTILRRHGYNVLEAANGGEAFLLCERYTAKIHILITDVVMPRMSGRQLAERVAALRPEMKVLYLSGYTESTIIHHGMLDAGIAFLQKPIVPESLLRKVREVLDGQP